MGMETGWLERFKEALETLKSRGVSMSALSLKAGRGRNFVQQMLTTGRDPGIEKLSSVLEHMPEADAIYVVTGIRITDRDLKFLRAMEGLPEGALDGLLGTLLALQNDEDAPINETVP